MPAPIKSDFEVVRRNKVYEEVAKQIERLILKKLKPGDKLPSERELAEMLQVSRSSIRPQNMRPVSEYLKLQGRFGHLQAEHIAKFRKVANEQWRMMGVELPEALIQAADAKNLVNMASAAEAETVAETV
jgi:DNA-binding transcriptional MocR family regulator